MPSCQIFGVISKYVNRIFSRVESRRIQRRKRHFLRKTGDFRLSFSLSDPPFLCPQKADFRKGFSLEILDIDGYIGIF